MAVTVNTALLTALRNALADTCASAQYKISGTWYDAAIASVGVQSNGAVHAAFYIPNPGSGSVSGCRIKDAQGNVLAASDDTYTFQSGEDAHLYRFKFSINTVEE